MFIRGAGYPIAKYDASIAHAREHYRYILQAWMCNLVYQYLEHLAQETCVHNIIQYFNCKILA